MTGSIPPRPVVATPVRQARRGTRVWRTAVCIGAGLSVAPDALAAPFELVTDPDAPMRTAGGRYAYAARIEREPAPPAAPTAAPATADDAASAGRPAVGVGANPAAAPLLIAASTSPAPIMVTAPAPTSQVPTGQAVALMPVQGPLILDNRYLGDINGQVDISGRGLVNATLLLDLLKPVLSSAAYEALRTRIGGQERVAMQDLTTSDFSISFDTFALSFVVDLKPTARALHNVSLGQREEVDPTDYEQPEPFAFGATFNVGQRYSHDRNDFSPMQGGVDLLANFGGFDGVTLSTGFDYDGSGDDKWSRREIRLTKDIFSSAIRLTAGEFAPPIDSFQGSNRILGLSAARAYSVIRPFQNIRPSGRQAFVLDRESLVEVEVNGVVIERLRLQPGPFSLADFPFGQGANTVRLLVDDDRGRREIAVFDLFGGSGLLGRGIMDFGLSAGMVEEGRLRYSDTLAGSGFARYGLTETLTVGGNLQAVGARSQAGLVAVQGTRMGLFQWSASASHNGDTGHDGAIGAVDFLRQFSLFEHQDTRFTASFQAATRYFQDAFATDGGVRERWRAAAQVFSRFRDYSLTLGAATIDGRDPFPDQRSYNMTLGRTFGRFGVNLSFSRQESDPGETDNRFGISLLTRLGDRWTGTARYDSRNDLAEVGIGRASTGDLNDLSGAVRISRDRDREALTADLRYINNRFDSQLVTNRLVNTEAGGASSLESLWRLSTTIGYADGVLAMGRPSREGFIIATRHPTLRKSQLTLTDGGGRAIARSGLFGPPLAPINRSYGQYRMVLQVDPLPAGYDLGSGLITAFPGYGSGYRVRIGSAASRTAMGVLMKAGEPLALVSGMIEPIGAAPDAGTAVEPRLFFTNRSGRFVGDGLAPGRYRMVVDGAVVGEFVVPEDKEGLVDVGIIQSNP